MGVVYLTDLREWSGVLRCTPSPSRAGESLSARRGDSASRVPHSVQTTESHGTRSPQRGQVSPSSAGSRTTLGQRGRFQVQVFAAGRSELGSVPLAATDSRAERVRLRTTARVLAGALRLTRFPADDAAATLRAGRIRKQAAGPGHGRRHAPAGLLELGPGRGAAVPRSRSGSGRTSRSPGVRRSRSPMRGSASGHAAPSHGSPSRHRPASNP